jgi:salicylate hydroxylase
MPLNCCSQISTDAIWQDFSPVAKAIVALPKEIKQYALFAGPRLDSVISHGSMALVGDTSHREFSS